VRHRIDGDVLPGAIVRCDTYRTLAMNGMGALAMNGMGALAMNGMRHGHELDGAMAMNGIGPGP